jgi:hypothetical protein
VSAPHLEGGDPFELQTGIGKRQAALDLNDPGQAATLRDLAAGTDVFSQGCRLGRRATENGSWHVQVSLCQTCTWYQRLGDDNDADAAGLGDVEPFTAVMDAGDFGPVRYLTPAVQMSGTPPRWDLPPARVGAHEPAWRPR